MIIVDLNLLIYAVNQDAPLHSKAKVWLEGALSGTETVGFAWNALLGFLRLSMNAAVFAHPLTTEHAFHVVDSWLSRNCSTIVYPGERHSRILGDLIKGLGVGGNLVSDAHLAAIAIEHGAEFFSADSDFARFPALHWRNPLL